MDTAVLWGVLPNNFHVNGNIRRFCPLTLRTLPPFVTVHTFCAS